MHLFNPEHDLALANFSPNYTPPASASLMAAELALLPAWYSVGDSVVAEGEQNRLHLEAVRQWLPVTSSLLSSTEISKYPNQPILPWGWNPALRKRLISWGVQEERLPTTDELLRLRDYSDRRHAVRMLRGLQEAEPAFCGESHHFTSLEELLRYLSSFPGDKLLKMPLSGSGKGLIRVLGRITDKQTDWCRRVIREQGGVVAEPVLNRVKDFAMEFYLEEGKARFAGFSLFRAAVSGAYLGNELLSDSCIKERLSAYIPGALLEQLRESLTVRLAARFPHYTGYAGVDMMICDTIDGYRLQPCVEINMRMNMGMVARIFHNQFMEEGGEGTFTVGYFKMPGNAFSFHQKMQQESPLRVVHGKIVSGYLSLTPVVANTRYVGYISVRSSPSSDDNGTELPGSR